MGDTIENDQYNRYFYISITRSVLKRGKQLLCSCAYVNTWQPCHVYSSLVVIDR